MNNLTLTKRIGISGSTFAFLTIFYITINRVIDVSNTAILPTFLDDYFPFTPIFIIPYILYYPAITVPPIFLENWNEIKHMLVSYGIILVITGTFYIVTPVRMIRPILPTDGGIFYSMVGIVYSLDAPVNCFPSQHAALIVAAAAMFKGKKSFVYWVILASLVVLSIAFIKQHWVIDGLFGVAIALFAHRIARYF